MLTFVVLVCLTWASPALAFDLPSATPSFLRPLFNNDPALKGPSASELLEQLEARIQEAPKNGIDTPKELEEDIVAICESLEKLNPTKSPVQKTDMMNGFWKLRWTNLANSGPSNGKLGPILGDVYQDIDLTNGAAQNIFRSEFPPLVGVLKGSLAPADTNSATTLAITFISVGTKLANFLPLGPQQTFDTVQIRKWEHVYLDDDYRIFFAKNPDTTASRGYVYVTKRAEEERFDTNI